MTRILACALMLIAGASSSAEDLHGFVQGERLEYRFESETVLWDLQGRYGGDYHRFWWKTEGDLDDGTVESAELQLLYSRAWTPFFDLQAGARFQDVDDAEISSLVLGVQGLAPYRFETDAALFISEDGDVTARAEFEREFVFGRSTVVQPRVEIGLSFQDVPELGLGAGVNEITVGLRVRHEITRKLAPYVGVSHETAVGSTADLIEAAGRDKSETTLVAGLRFWF